MNIPNIITKRLALTVLVGAGFFFVSLAYFLYAGDTLLLCLGSFLFILCGIRCGTLFFQGLTGAYTVLEGECLEISPLAFSRYQKVMLLDDTGETLCLQLEKGCRLQPGSRYQLYFTEKGPKGGQHQSLLLKRASSAGNFIGAEEVPTPDPADLS